MRGLVHPLDMGLVQGTCPNPALYAECQTCQKRGSFLVFDLTPPRRLVVFEKVTPGLGAAPTFFPRIFDFICRDSDSLERGETEG